MGKISLSDEIQAEVDKYYLPRPLFEDGEPLQREDFVDLGEGFSFSVCGLEYDLVNNIVTMIGDNGLRIRLKSDDKLKHPPEPEVQEKLFSETLSLLLNDS